jgi:hypothetical protein
MYVDVRRRLVFLDKSISTLNISSPMQYDVATGEMKPVIGALPDDVVTHITDDATRLALHSAKWLRAYGKNRVRLTFLKGGAPTLQTDKFMFFWTRFDPSGNYALVSGDGRKRPFLIEVNTGVVGAQLRQNFDARSGDIDPLDGRLWVPDGRANNLLSVDCRTGEIKKVEVPLAGMVTRVRFAHDGTSLFVAGSHYDILCCDRDGSMIWSTSLADYAKKNAPSTILSNESGTHICASLWESKRSEWGEDIIISAKDGRVEKTILSHKGPPARLAKDWFGDRLLTYAGEIIDFYSGEMIGRVNSP